jgi:ribosomal protein L21E
MPRKRAGRGIKAISNSRIMMSEYKKGDNVKVILNGGSGWITGVIEEVVGERCWVRLVNGDAKLVSVRDIRRGLAQEQGES